MNAGRGGGGGGEAGPSKRSGNTTGERKPKKKKAKDISRPSGSGPIPAPYLAIAPSPVSSLGRNALHDLVLPAANHLVLPSTFVRARSSANVPEAPAPGPVPASSRRGYAANLAAPPLIMPGGTSATPRIQELPAAPTRRRGDGRRRSEEGLRVLAQANQSMASLGALGRIMESDPTTQGEPVQRRRRRVVRADGGVREQPTVSTREEGRAIGLARGASMRRLSVWDGLPDSGEAPPPFVVPLPRPPGPAASPPLIDEDDPPPPFEARGRSPPPTWEQATGIAPLGPAVPVASAAATPQVTIETASRPTSIRSIPSSPGTQYASAQESQASGSEDEPSEQEREDRRLWNADISSGYSLVQRVQREEARKRSREVKEVGDTEGETEDVGSAASGDVAATAPARASPVLPGTSPAAPTEVAGPSPTPGTPSAPIMAIPEREVIAPTSPAPAPNPPAAEETSNTTAEPSSAESASTSPAAVIILAPAPRTTAPSVTSYPSAPASSVSAAPSRSSSIMRKSRRSTGLAALSAAPVSAPDSVNSTAGATPIAGPSSNVAVERPESVIRTRKRSAKGKSPSVAIATAQTSAVHTVPATASTSPADVQESQAETESSSAGRVAVDPVAASASLPPVSAAEQSQADTESPLVGRPTVETAAVSASQPALSAAEQSQADTYRTLTGRPAAVPVIGSPSSSPKLSPAEQSQADTYRALTGTSGPGQSSPRAPATPDPSESPRPPSRPSPDALASVREGTEESSSQVGSDVAIAPVPKRKLTRGKAIRRSSSGFGLPGAEAVTSPESPRRPLFADKRSDWRSTEDVHTTQGHTASPRVRPGHKKSSSSIAILRSPPQSAPDPSPSVLPPGRALGSSHTTFEVLPAPESPISPVLLPHREAALKRRELVTRSPEITMSAPSPTVEVPAPLVDLSDAHRHPPYRSPPPTISRDLYQLFDEPVAESSAQAAARMEQEQILRTIKRDRREWAVEEVRADDLEEDRAPTPSAKGKRIPPPPPPLRRNLISTTVGANLTPRRSIIRSADSPVTPRPIRQLSVGSQDRPPALPTRRPAPPPPQFGDAQEQEAPPLPPRPAPIYRPLNDRRESGFSVDTGSSLSDSRTTPILHSTSASPRRPKGPRPPPPPPRWARIIMPLNDVKAPLRPSSERSQSDRAGSPVTPARMGRRSTSEQDMRSSSGGTPVRSPIEYTDLDVLVSRLEGSGREYEGFSQITAFLGPGKSLAATPEALSTLLPGLISVDSRRVTGQGKVKLKLSLLGVRVTKCPICLGQFKKDEQGVLLPECGHVSHEECATKWFREDCRCFVCRVPLLRDDAGWGVGESGERRGEGVV